MSSTLGRRSDFGHTGIEAVDDPSKRVGSRGWEVYYWKDRSHEVDLVALGPKGEKWALEIKSGAWDDQELGGLRKFVHLYPEFAPYIVGQERPKPSKNDLGFMTIEEILCCGS